jgi:hypothetical protein
MNVGVVDFLCARLGVFAALQLRVQVFWDVKLFHWVSDVLRFQWIVVRSTSW